MSKAAAFEDFIQELRKGGTPESVAAEIAPEYDVNPEFLLRRFAAQYPEGLPHVDLNRAKELEAAAKQKQIKDTLAENQAVADFFTQNPTRLPTSNRAAMQIIRENESRLKLVQGIEDGIRAWPSRYADRQGKMWIAARLADIKSNMIEKGWRNVSRLDEGDLEDMGFKIVEATYTQSVRPTGKYIRVVVLDEA